jgi:hypothetical protein
METSDRVHVLQLTNLIFERGKAGFNVRHDRLSHICMQD